MIYVTEAGMYTVILRSDSPLAKPMQKWVTSEVLPTIRKTGGYIVASPEDTPEIVMARICKENNPKVVYAEAECYA